LFDVLLRSERELTGLYELTIEQPFKLVFRLSIILTFAVVDSLQPKVGQLPVQPYTMHSYTVKKPSS
jgi:hypothetical protein